MVGVEDRQSGPYRTAAVASAFRTSGEQGYTIGLDPANGSLGRTPLINPVTVECTRLSENGWTTSGETVAHRGIPCGPIPPISEIWRRI